MGAYLNRPVVEKEKEEGTGNGFSYACTTMQGWRANQEDAHNCVVDLHPGWHMFAVYDGHGGTEVSKFTAARLPEFLKTQKFWESENVEECLQKTFVEFDDFIRSENSLKELKDISNVGKKKKESDSEDEADRINTIEESSLPIAELIKKYGIVGGGGAGRSLLSAFLGGQEVSDDEDEEEEEEEDEKKEKEDKEEEKEKEQAGDAEVEEAAEDVPRKKVHKRCSKSPLQSEAKKAKGDHSEEPTAGESAVSSSSSGPKVDGGEEEEESDKEFVADEEEDVEEEQSDEEVEEADLSQFMLGPGGAETPGEDSGTTACVVLVSGDKIVVANAGDSRAVLCRAGKALDLSIDHKPEDEIETTRIHAAGGTIEEGRVNGGLNLSRALGDHAYKKNQALPLKDQMITALPDVKIESLTPEDEFLIVACDGIWNSMESQQVVDFVRGRLDAGKSCSEICDELCDECLAETTDGDGTGCDNMTVICTTFKRS